MKNYKITDKHTGSAIGVVAMTTEQARKAERDFIVKEAQPKRSSDRPSKMATCQLMMASRTNKERLKGGKYEIRELEKLS